MKFCRLAETFHYSFTGNWNADSNSSPGSSVRSDKKKTKKGIGGMFRSVSPVNKNTIISSDAVLNKYLDI